MDASGRGTCAIGRFGGQPWIGNCRSCPENSDAVASMIEIQPQPWPVLMLPLKLLAKPEDKGLGDIVARTIGPLGGDAFKVWYQALFGQSCGCDARQEVWNQKWPL